MQARKIIIKDDQIRGIKTNLGKINCEYIVLCAGMWSRQIGEAAGVSIPLYPNEHFYMLTEDYNNLPKIFRPLEIQIHTYMLGNITEK